MKRSLRDTLNKKTPANAGDIDERALPEEIRGRADRYRGMSESRLMEELLAETRKRKAEGSYDAASIRNGVNALLPMLDEEQKRKLYEIIGRMDRQ